MFSNSMMMASHVAAPPSGGFTPADVLPLADNDFISMSSLFQDSAKTIPVTATGQSVGAGLDLSGSARDLIQTASTSRPVYTASELPNGSPAIVTDGLGQGLFNSVGTFTGPKELWMLLSIKSWTNDSSVFMNRTGSTFRIRMNGRPNKLRFLTATSDTDMIIPSGYFILRVVANGTTSSIYVNGASVASGIALPDIPGQYSVSYFEGFTIWYGAIGLGRMTITPLLTTANATNMLDFYKSISGIV